jgi:hypothetical protein
MKDERLEKLSDSVRRGEPISLPEILEVISYQETLKKNKKPTFFERLLSNFKR